MPTTLSGDEEGTKLSGVSLSLQGSCPLLLLTYNTKEILVSRRIKKKKEKKKIMHFSSFSIQSLKKLPELLLVIVRRCGEGGWNIHSFGPLCNGSSQQVFLAPKRYVQWLWDQAFGHWMKSEHKCYHLVCHVNTCLACGFYTPGLASTYIGLKF